MKTVILAISLLTSSMAFSAAEQVKGLGAHNGDPCFCPTCPGNNKCQHTQFNEDRKVSDKLGNNKNVRSSRGTKVGQE